MTVTDTQILDAIEWAGADMTVYRGRARFPGDEDYRLFWYVSGAGLGNSSGLTFREAALRWLTGLVECAERDPDYFDRFSEMPHFGRKDTP